MESANGHIIKNGVFPVTTLFFWKLCFSSRTSYKELIWCTNDPNVHIHTFRKRWSYIWEFESAFYLWVSLTICSIYSVNGGPNEKNVFVFEKSITENYGYCRVNRSSHRRCSVRKGVLRNFAKFTRKHLSQSLFLKKRL